MKKFLLVMWVVVNCLSFLYILSSCSETSEDIKTDIIELGHKRMILNSEINKIEKKLSQTENAISTKMMLIKDLDIKIKEMKIYETGRVPNYILTLKLKQSHFSLSLETHAKDALNAITFQLPVSKQFYESVKIGTNIVDKFRFGSFILCGTFGDWRMTVEGKQIN